MKLIEKMLKGDRLSLARVITLIEDRDESLRKIIEKIYPKTGNAFVLGITGPPGAGKSTVTDRLIAEARKSGKRVAVMAVDPSSPFTGGAILGDRIRMQTHTQDDGVYIRSLGTRGKHGGLSQSSREVVMALDAAGFDWIIVETAGVGQTELDILKLAHVVNVVLVPESGDGIQVMKAGLMEIADLFVVNKSDRPEADRLVRELVTMVGMNEHDSAWEIPVIKTQALHNKGIDELYQKLLDYHNYAMHHNLIDQKRKRFLQDEIVEIIQNKISNVLFSIMTTNKGIEILNNVEKKQENPYEAAEMLMSIILDKKTLK